MAGLLGQTARRRSSAAAWPLLRIADRGQRVLAAQHLLRARRLPGVVPDGRFTRELADAVRAFQAERGFGRDDPDLDSGDGPNGMIGGETWPALARAGAGRARAARRSRPSRCSCAAATSAVPDVVTPEIWQRLLTP